MVDYSKFEHIDDSDDEQQDANAKPKPSPAKREPVPSVACSNCNKLCTKPLRCGKCKVAAYCCAACQKQDWSFHKRTCKEPVSMEQKLQQQFPGAFCLGGQGLPTKPMPQVPHIQHPPKQVQTEYPSTTLVEEVEELPSSTLIEEIEEEEEEQDTHSCDPQLDSQVHQAIDQAIVSADQEAFQQQVQDSELEDVKEAPASAEDAQKNVRTRSEVSASNEAAGLGYPGDFLQNERCTNCLQRCAKPLRCSVCKEATYCSLKCQKEDWRMHKSSCKKPKPKVRCQNCSNAFKDNIMFCLVCGARRPDEATAQGQPEPLRPTQSDTEKIQEEEVEDWYRHREWRPEVKQEFCPKRIDTDTPCSEVENPKRLDAESACIESESQKCIDAQSACATAEKTAGEGKEMLQWWKKRLASLQIKCEDAETRTRVEVEKVINVSGEASIVHTQETVRHLFNLQFRVCFDVDTEEASASGFMLQTSSCGRVHVSGFSNETCGACQMKVEGTDVAVKFGEGELFPKLRDALLECVADYEKEV